MPRSLPLAAFLFCLLWASAARAQVAPTPAQQQPYTHKVYDDLKLSDDVAIDDPDRMVEWIGDKPHVMERAADPDKWLGDPKYWSDGEFVESDFPAIYKPGTPGVNVACSKHIRIVFGNHPMMTEEYVRGNLRMFEECLKLYYLKMGYPVPLESRDPAKRDGRKHKVNILVGASNLPPVDGKAQYTGGGAFGGFDGDTGFGFLYVGPEYMRHTPPSGATPHELGHSIQNQCNTHSRGSGFWWEAHANWLMLQFINTYPAAPNVQGNAELYWGHGRHYYDCWHIFEHLKDEPGFGYDFIRRIWTEGGPKEDQEYLWSKADRFAEPRSMSDEWGKMARRNVTWDYRRHDIFAAEDKDTDTRLRYGRILLEPVPARPGWWRVPWHMAPQQFGYNICPLRPTARAVTVDLQGYADPARGADWRASLVAVNAAGQPRYSALWNRGKTNFALRPDESQLYLVVSATPRVMEIWPEQDYRGLEKERFPYAVQLQGAEPLDLMATDGPPLDAQGRPIAGKPHPNGGGFVADTARVDATAFVGPHARVLDHAQVTGQARLDDWAVVCDVAVVGGNAVLSGHARIANRGHVSGQAHVADYGLVRENATVGGFARIIEHGAAIGSVQVGDTATHEGHAVSWGGRTYGDATLDGDYANALTVGQGTWFHWFVNTQQAVDAAPDDHGIAAQYTFDRAHPYLAWDTFGEEHGLLVGSPVIHSEPSGQVEPVADVVQTLGRLDVPDSGQDNWGALVRGYLHPPAAGDYTFYIASDDESELWLSSDADPRHKVKICGVSGGWTGRDDFNHMPSQKSKPVTLDPARTYYFEALHKEADGADLLQVAWEAPGLKREIISGDALSLEPNGPRGSALRLVWLNVPGRTVADLTSSPKFKADATRPVDKHYLALNGRDQYVELRRRLTYRPAFGARLQVRRDVVQTDSKLFDFSSVDGKNRLVLMLTATGQPRFVVRRDGQDTTLVSPRALPAGQWATLGVSLDDRGASLQIGDTTVVQDAQLAVRPWDLRITEGFLGRGREGSNFKGALADVTFYGAPQTTGGRNHAAAGHLH